MWTIWCIIRRTLFSVSTPLLLLFKRDEEMQTASSLKVQQSWTVIDKLKFEREALHFRVRVPPLNAVTELLNMEYSLTLC